MKHFLIVSSLHSVHLAGLTCISTWKIPLNTISKNSDIFNSSLQNPIDFICIFSICPTLIYSLGFKTDLARKSSCSLPRQGFCVTQHPWCVFSCSTNCIRFNHQHSDRLNELQVGYGRSDFLYNLFHLNHGNGYMEMSGYFQCWEISFSLFPFGGRI